MKVFATSLLVAATAAIEHISDVPHIHAEDGSVHVMNSHYDYNDPTHHHYGSSSPASPAAPVGHDFNLAQAVNAFDPHGTLFGEHRYQFQVAKTGNMLIGTEALRESIATLQDRVHHARIHVINNDGDIDENDSDIEDNRRQITENRARLHALDDQISSIEHGYADLHHKLAVDREALIMMCHQYAYASTIPDECLPIIGGLSAPIDFHWYWPQDPCPDEAHLPPFNYPVPHYEKETTDDGDDHPNAPHPHPTEPIMHY